VGGGHIPVSEPQRLLPNRGKVSVLGGGVSNPEPKGLNLKEEGRGGMRKTDGGDGRNGGFV